MRRSDSQDSATPNSDRTTARWNRKHTTICLAVAVLGSCLAIRWIDGPDQANAQTARRQKSQTASTKSSVNQDAVSKPSIVAVVNGQDISRHELRRRVVFETNGG